MGVAPVTDEMPAQLRAAVTEGSQTAFMNGVHTAVLVTGILALVGAALAVIGLRGRGDEALSSPVSSEATPLDSAAQPRTTATASVTAEIPSSSGTPVSDPESAPVPRAPSR